MQILTSRSTVALEDRQVIEQLIFTAKELAATAARTAGFEYTGESNQRLGLEMWEGAAYACRPSEEVTIKNIFLCNFLERLREIVRNAPPAGSAAARTHSTTEMSTEPSVGPTDSPTVISEIPELGLGGESTTSYGDECVPECERENWEEESDGSAVDHDPAQVELTADHLQEPNASEAAEVAIAAVVNVPEEQSVADTMSGSTVETGVPVIESVALSENEPYRFESCTVTVVLQLLPVEVGNRKCVVSIRSHDFTPYIEIASLNGDLPAGELAFTIGSAIEKYRNDFPVRAADKLKRQAVAGKKAAAKSVNSPKPVVQPAAAIDARKTTGPTTTAVGGQQAGLFGG